MLLRLGYFEEFLCGNVILLAGDVGSLKFLADSLRRLENSNAQPIEIHRIPFCKCYGDVQLTALPVTKELGIRRRPESTAYFSWQHSEEGWLEAAEKIDELVLQQCGHQFLECVGAEDATVIVSLGEYDDGWWEQHGTRT